MTRSKNEGRAKRVGIWIRVSTDQQAKGESPEHHEKRARAYAESKEWEIVTVYDLAGVSGKSVWDHPETRRMMADIRERRISGLIFSKLARLARNTKQLLEFAEFFKEQGADMISLGDSIDTTTPAGRLFFTINAGVAQFEREETADRVAASIPIRAKMGKSLGGVAPFGYRWQDKRLVIDEKEAPVRRLLYDLFLEHKRKTTVARLLNKAGHRMRTGKPFTWTAIDRLLADPVAKGSRRVNFSYSRARGGGTKPVNDWVYIEVPSIVPEDVWDACQAILKAQEKPKAKPSKKAVHLFAGLVFCNCGKKMYVPWKGRSYICQQGCRNRVGEEDLETVFNEQLKGFFLSSEQVRDHLERADEKLQEKSRLQESLEAERQKVAAEMEKLYRLYQDDHISGQGFAEKNGPLEARVRQLEDEIPRLAGEIDFLRLQLLSSTEVVSEAQDLHTRWTKLTFDEKRQVIEGITDRIVVADNEITIDLAYLPPGGKPPPESAAKSQRLPRRQICVWAFSWASWASGAAVVERVPLTRCASLSR